MRPIRLHLDTSDYALMYRAAPGTPQADVRDELKRLAQSGQIEIGLSYHVVFELLQKAEPKYREDRLARARLLTDLCGQNAFPYPSDLGEGPYFSKEGLWVPRLEFEDVEIERIVEIVMQSILSRPEINRHERRVLSKRKYFAACERDNPARLMRLAGEVWPLKFGQEFVESGEFSRYILGEITRSEANSKLRFYITDPVTVYKLWFEQYGRDDPIVQRRDAIANKFVLMLEELEAKLRESIDLQRMISGALAETGDDALSREGREKLLKLKADNKTFRAEMPSPHELCEQVPVWKTLFGNQAALVAAQILYAFHCEKRAIKPSDGIDFVHAMYLPYTDLWRGDRAFSDLLIKHRVDFSDRIVSALIDLPDRIEAEIVARRRTHK